MIRRLGRLTVPRFAARIIPHLGALLTTGLCAAPLAAAPAGAQPGRSSRPPNLIVILADDLGYGDICAYGCANGRTPNIDALAASGVRFTQGYVTAPVCSPSRAALLTGRYQQRFGHEFNPSEKSLGIPVGERLFPQYMKDRGYATGIVGKWHLGGVPELLPLARGFDEFFGFAQAAHLFLDPATPNVHFVDRGAHQRGAPPKVDPNNPILRGNEPVEEKEYLTEALTREAVSFIERHRAEPFFLYVAYNAPHTPLQVTDEYWNRFPEIADEGQRIYAAMVAALDDGIGKITAALDESGLRDSTLVVFTSDNGCATYTAACTNGELVGGKVTFFEGGVRVPFLASWPGKVPAGRVVEEPVSTLDLLPTALELSDAKAPAERQLDGKSLLPLLRGDATTIARDGLYWRNSGSWATRQGSWKLIQYEGEPPFLFDLAADAGESRNLAAAQPERVAEITRRYREWEKGMIAPLWPMRVTYHVPLQEILDRKPMRLLKKAEPGTIEVEF